MKLSKVLKPPIPRAIHPSVISVEKNLINGHKCWRHDQTVISPHLDIIPKDTKEIDKLMYMVSHRLSETVMKDISKNISSTRLHISEECSFIEQP